MAAYGLYTHIQSNKRRSIALLVGLFFLVYLLVYAVALLGEALSLNAFATGMNERQYSITVTSGLLNSLNDAELESVLGHELTHIRNGDVRMLVIAVIIAGVIAFFAELIFRLLFQGGLRWRGGRG